ncbi:hypothetical protein TPHA_0J02670 [Tetrapisispora phaffii CBS 4417]|uniref:Phosphoribosylaminoimidazole carboxylase n=1 Tax=Tetrapisispora phaffii (strain ATCC 24235 / CBS 4417 / NBRC 1672 / NRRL Y-8282 / UCD 70-5) TaxID=1071381 RepID=G8BYZ5_TETPH|nr:hypothetical protein TPHA_0J02670 [Tetrapisispora phaffii CBS 4417]CCE65087.1 hypothetical protein TPHA_0J02670 [Tetrapisispora phaffii CBS 4417]
MDQKTLGILGGGQLGRMLVEAANRLNVKTVILEKGADCSAKQISNSTEHVDGSFTDPEKIQELAKKCNVLTIEIEHVNTETLADLKKLNPRLKIYPTPETIKIIQDKFSQKLHLTKNNIPVVESYPIENICPEELNDMGTKLNYPYMLKARTFAYDGRGNFVIKNKNSIDEAIKFFTENKQNVAKLYAEKWCPFKVELAVMVVRSLNNKVYSYSTVETIHKDNICHVVYAPARIPDSVQFEARLVAENAIKSFDGAGIFGVEMFYSQEGKIIINEIAPRPHNSGHYTIDACVTSQFEAHLRSVLDLPMPEGFTNFTTCDTNAIMINVLGDREVKDKELEYCERALATPNASVYLYGKESKPQRKLGHINIVSSSMHDCERKLHHIVENTSLDPHVTDTTLNKPLVGIIMGSDSDLPVMSAACDILKQFSVPFDVTIVSAHRTPHRMSKYAVEASKRGMKVIIAGAGGAAHLPGMVAAMTPLPVIGVPVKGSCLDGVDSLHSIVQMPRGVPVATVAINNSTNAALLAVRILGAYNDTYFQKMQAFLLKQEEEILQKAQKLEDEGYEQYLTEMKK